MVRATALCPKALRATLQRIHTLPREELFESYAPAAATSWTSFAYEKGKLQSNRVGFDNVSAKGVSSHHIVRRDQSGRNDLREKPECDRHVSAFMRLTGVYDARIISAQYTLKNVVSQHFWYKCQIDMGLCARRLI